MEFNFANLGSLLACQENEHMADTKLHLDFMGTGFGISTGMVYSDNNDDLTQTDSHRLVLGLGPTPTSYCADHSHVIDKTNKSENLFSRIMSSGDNSDLLQLALSSGDVQPVLARSHVNHVMESTKNYGAYMPHLHFAPRPEMFGDSSDKPGTHELLDVANAAGMLIHHNFSHHVNFSPEPSATTDSIGAISDPMNVSTGDQRAHTLHPPKKCRSDGCSKGARGASGLCIAHGGGQRCQKPGCNKGAESRTAYCKAHGGGRRCQHLGCTKSAEGKTDRCIAHGGGRRCGYSDCTKAARGKSGLCIRHGGGKRCTVEDCARSAEGQAGLCISHGGGRRCQHTGCNKGAQGSTMHCKAHGGGKRCNADGCTKGAEGSTPRCKAHGGGKRCLFEGGGACPKSVHGGTDYCVAHGGGKRCIVANCTKSARGRTDCCVRHGGGKRCQIDRCGKSAQGSTDYCKAHGGGKRCSWPQGCEKFARGKSGLCAAHGSMTAQHHPDGRILQTTTMTGGSSMENGYSSYADSAISDCAESSGNFARRQMLVQPQAMVAMPMKLPLSPSVQMVGHGSGGGASQDICYGFAIPEGRVHGGGLMSLLGGSLKSAFDAGKI